MSQSRLMRSNQQAAGCRDTFHLLTGFIDSGVADHDRTPGGDTEVAHEANPR